MHNRRNQQKYWILAAVSHCCSWLTDSLLVCRLNRVSLTAHVGLNASRIATNDFDGNKCSRMSVRSVCGNTAFAPAQLQRNCSKQRPSNHGDHGTNFTGNLRQYYTEVDVPRLSFLNHTMWFVLGYSMPIKTKLSLNHNINFDCPCFTSRCPLSKSFAEFSNFCCD